MKLFTETLKYSTFALVLISTVAFASIRALAQYEPVCTKIEQAINQKMKDTVLHRNDPSTHGCDIEFTRPNLMVSLEVYENDNKSREGFDSTVRLFRTERVDEDLKPIEDLPRHGTWNKALFVPSTNKTSHSVVLLNGKYVISLLSPSRELLLDVEVVLRHLFPMEGLRSVPS